MTTDPKHCEIRNTGPIEAVVFDLPIGVVETKGPHGSGKSTLQLALRACWDNEARKQLEPRDGTPKATINALGVAVSVAKQGRTKGRVQVDTLDPGLDPVDGFTDPPLKTAEGRDAARMKFAVRVAGVEITASEWMAHVGKEHAQTIDAACVKNSDPVLVANGLRLAFHEQAQTVEGEQSDWEGQEAALRAAIKDEPTEAADDAALKAAEQKALAAITRAETQREAADAARTQQAKAKADLDKYAGEALDLAACEKLANDTGADHRDALAGIDELNEQAAQLSARIDRAVRGCEQLSLDLTKARENVDKAKRQAEYLAKLRKTIDAAVPDAPTPEDLMLLYNEREAASDAIRDNERAKAAAKKQTEADEAKAKAESAARQATDLRKLARSCDDALAVALRNSGCDFLVPDGGRLYFANGDERELVDRLSATEKDELAFRLMISGIRQDGILTISQPAWSQMLPARRKAIHEAAVAAGVCVVASLADIEGPLRVEPFDPEG